MHIAQHNARVAVVTCTPMAKITGPRGDLIYKPISPLWHRARAALSFGTNINTSEMLVDGLEVGDARSRTAAQCLAMKTPPYFLLFIDSDVIVPPDAFTKLFYHLKTKPHIDIAAGVYVVKGAPPYDPLIYRENGEGAFWDWAAGDILTTAQHGIRAVHMGLTLIRVSLFQRMKEAGLVHGDGTNQDDEPFFCTENYTIDEPGKGRQRFQGTEDIYFCEKARKLDAQILVDTSVIAGHVDENTGMVYGLPADTSPIERAKWLPLPDGSGRRKDRTEAEANEERCEDCKAWDLTVNGTHAPCATCDGTGKVKKPLKLAIDLGAGESHRVWPGHKTYRLDARRDTKPDYCQEMENLNLPDDHFDLVASRHAFEHVGRFAQERLWKEAFRVCRPGGKCEIIVPNAEWAAAKIVEGEMDMHALNVLIGGHETDADMKDDGLTWNVHKFLYTPTVIRALAEGAGFVDVQIEDFKSNPDVGYHMKLTGTKPDEPHSIMGMLEAGRKIDDAWLARHSVTLRSAVDTISHLCVSTDFAGTATPKQLARYDEIRNGPIQSKFYEEPPEVIPSDDPNIPGMRIDPKLDEVKVGSFM